MSLIARRSFLSLLAAPAIVPASSLMRLSPAPAPAPEFNFNIGELLRYDPVTQMAEISIRNVIGRQIVRMPYLGPRTYGRNPKPGFVALVNLRGELSCLEGIAPL